VTVRDGDGEGEGQRARDWPASERVAAFSLPFRRAGSVSERPPALKERVAQVRGILAERVVLSTSLDPFLNLKAASDYTQLSVKTLRRAVNDTPERALACYRIGAAIILRRSELDAWIVARRTVGRPSLVAAMRSMGLRTPA
jgi:hypothetical protein